MHQFFYYTGILTCTLLLLWLLLRLLLGKNWIIKLSARFLLGPSLLDSSKKLGREIKEKDIQVDTLAEVSVNVLKRFTRIGVFAVLAALIPAAAIIIQVVLLNRQNALFEFQNTLFDSQNRKIDDQTALLREQTLLFRNQNEKLDTQTRYMGQQNSLVDFQNRRIVEQIGLMAFQNVLLDTQNYRLNLQNNLIEADRRGALVILMSNIMDQMNAEILEQKKQGQAHFDSVGYSLSDPLIGRIAALSQGFLPYRYLEGDTLTKNAVSPERGQLLLALVKSNLDSITYNKIYEAADFGSAYLKGADLSWADLSRADLHGADLSLADLHGADLSLASLRGADLSLADLSRADLRLADLRLADLRGADLSWADLSWADLSWADLSGTDLSRADLRGAFLRGAKHLTADQLKTALSLDECRGLDSTLQQQLQKEKPCLFTGKGCKY